MKALNKIQVFEHERLICGDSYFKQHHLIALLKLNELHNFEYFDSVPNGVKFKQYVGIIQVDNLTIEILPKADKDGDESSWRNVLIQMLKACHKLKASTYGDADVKRQNLNLLEIYFSIFLTELSGLIKQGLIKQYRLESSNIKSLKGKIIFSKNINKNFVHAERFFTKHQVYDRDHELHQILNSALKVIEQFTRGTYLFDNCKRIQLDFPEVGEINITKKLLDNFQLTRKTKAYTKAFEIARLILLNYSPDISSGNEKMLALLFDMNKLWEEYILIKLREELHDPKFEIMAKDSRSFWGLNYLNPDIVITDKSVNPVETFIIDTKWKRPGNSSASIQDLRQMYAYNRFWNCSKAVLLYPGDPKFDSFKEFKNIHDSKKHFCKMAFVHVLDNYGKLNQNLGLDIIKEIEFKQNEIDLHF